ncbi:MAG: hypothetical protein K1X65_09770 [Caldilineales bacterium]|nr:hypothetical protein [Caldilineales bacterium]
MTHDTNLYAGWWLYVGLVGGGMVLFLTGSGGAWLWAGLALMLALALAGLLAWRAGYGPRRRLSAVLAADGLALLDPGQRRGQQTADAFIPWREISAVRLIPRPGYWQTDIQTTTQPDAWLMVGSGLAVAEEIAAVAALPYAADLRKPVDMGVEHHWRRM